MKIIKIYSSWNQLKLKARVGHYNTEAHVRILGQGGRGATALRQRRQHKTFIGEKCAPGPWSGVSRALDMLGHNGWAINVYTRNVFQTATITITTLTPLQLLPDQLRAQSDKHHQVNPGLRQHQPGVPGMMAASVASVRPDWVSLFVQGISDKSLAVRDIRALLSDVTRSCDARCDQGAGGGAAGVSGGLSGMILVTIVMTWDKYAATMADDNDTPHCFTQMNSICWSITQPQHVINFQSWRLVYSRTQYWHTQLHFQFLLVFLGLLKLLLTQMMKLRCHDSILWDDYCYYN